MGQTPPIALICISVFLFLLIVTILDFGWCTHLWHACSSNLKMLVAVKIQCLQMRSQ